MFSLTMGSGTGAVTYINEGVANIPTSVAVFTGSATFSIFGAKVASMLSSQTLNLIMKPVIILTIPLTLAKTDACRQLMDHFQLHEQVPKSLIKRRNSLSQRADVQHNMSVGECLDAVTRLAEAGPRAMLDASLGFVWTHQEYFAIGACAGFANGLIGVGGGVVLMTLLGHNMPQHEAVATGIAALFPSGLLTSVYNLARGTLVLRAGLIVGAANMAGMYGGARFLAPHVDEDQMRYLFASVLVASLLK